MARLVKSADELYEKHKRLIYKLIHRFAKDGYADIGDLESLSNEVFTKCFRKWEPGKAAFSTLLHTALCNAFMSELKKGETRLRNEGEAMRMSETMEDIDSTEWFLGFLQVIDNDARYIVGKLFRQEVNTRKSPITKKETKEGLQRIVVLKPDWTKARVTRAFKSIKAALRT